jgi:predicted Ser/Thr protein kinase
MDTAGTTSTSGTVVGNRYSVDLDRPIGVGGMAMVYEGFDLQSRRRVALKTLRPEYQRDPASRQRFRREARAMAFVSHPNLVTIYDLHDEQDGSWVVMEYLEGETLKELVQRDGPLPPESVTLILQQLANALSHLHERNLVHLDIKPQNIMLSPAGEVKLIDFGLAQPPGGHTEMDGGMAFGTVAYLAPEQARGDAVTGATDVYSLGCVVYELLTGHLPFDVPDGPRQKRDMINHHLRDLPDAPSTVVPELELPSWIDDVLGWALMKHPSERIGDVRTFARLFRSGLDGESLGEPDATVALRDAVGATSTLERPRVRFRRKGRHRDGERAASPFEDDIPELHEDRAGSMARLYRRGGRLARRARGVRRLMWRLFAVMVIGTLLLGVVLALQQGPTALVERFLSVAPGVETISEGDTVRVTGLSRTDGEFRFWPVETEIEGRRMQGWVWSEGLQPNAWTGRLSWVQDLVDRGQSMRDDVPRFWNRIPGQ